MGTTRRDFIKDATVVGAAVVETLHATPLQPAPYAAESVAETVKSDSSRCRSDAADSQAGETERCPYFDQPLLCKGLAPEGKRLCDE